MRQRAFDVLVIGAGPAGLAAAARAARHGKVVAVLDDNPLPGGQVWRGSGEQTAVALARRWLTSMQLPTVHLLTETTVIGPFGRKAVLAQTAEDTLEVRFDRLILATGARERFLPFPGWTLPGVVGAGGLQALVKGGLPIAGRRIVVAGTGPLLLAVAAYLKRHGAQIQLVAEQAPRSQLLTFVPHVARDLTKLRQAGSLAWELRDVPFRTSCWVVAAHGNERIEAVTMLAQHGDSSVVPCDFLACGFGLVPNLELALAFGCSVAHGAVVVDDWQQTSLAGIYAAGEVTGVGGVEAALIEGQIAGEAAIGDLDAARRSFATRTRARQFAGALNRHFALRPELQALADDDTLICRCEDVTVGALRRHTSWRSAKLHTRCGMGPCQGRICGQAAAFLFGWTPDSIRPPMKAARVESLILSHSRPSQSHEIEEVTL